MIAGFVALTATLGAADAWAQGHGRRGGRWMKHLKSVNLTPPQIQKIRQLRVDMVTKVAPLRAQLGARKAELRELWLAKTPSRGAIVAKHSAIDALGQKIRDARIDFKLRVLALLTPQQRTQLKSSVAAGPPRGKGGKALGKRGKRGKRGKNLKMF